jgi:hypothetical protein
MKTKLLASIFLGLIAGGALFAASDKAEKTSTSVEVTFVAPEKFTDVKNDYMENDRDREYILEQLKDHLVKRASKQIASGQRLEIKVTDVDLAGDFEPWRGPNFHDVRIVKDLYPPRVTLEFRLIDASGKVVSEGKRQLRDMAFLMSIASPTSDPLRYDKEMLSNWVRDEFRRAS